MFTFDRPPTYHIYINLLFSYHLPTSVCKRKLWTTPKLGISCNRNLWFSLWYAIGNTHTQRVFWPQIYFMPLVSVPGGQDRGLSKQNFMRNLNFKVSASIFQPELNKLQTCPKLSSKTHFLGGFLNFVQIWLESRGWNLKIWVPHKILLS